MSGIDPSSNEQVEWPSIIEYPDALSEALSDVPHDVLNKDYHGIDFGRLTPEEATEWSTPASSSGNLTNAAPNVGWSSDYGFVPQEPVDFSGDFHNNSDVGYDNGWSNDWLGEWSSNQVLPHAPRNVQENFQDSFDVAPNYGWSNNFILPYESNNSPGSYQNIPDSLDPDSVRWGHTKARSSPHRSPARSKSPSTNYRVSPYSEDRSGRSFRTGSPIGREDDKSAQAKCSHSDSSLTAPIATAEASGVQSTSHKTTAFRAKLSPASIASLKQISELIPSTKRGPRQFEADIYNFCSTDGERWDVFRLKTYVKLFEYYGYTTPVPYPVKKDQRRYDGPGALAKGLESVRDYALSDKTGKITISEETFSTVKSIIEISEKLDDVQMTISKLVGGSLATRKPKEDTDKALNALTNIRDKNEFPKDPDTMQCLHRVLADHYPAKGLIDDIEWLENKQLTGEFDSLITREPIATAEGR